ncbi:MAG: hypothetical protein OQL20_03995 [Sedimenticola sp.]|nr:hypothetical protein [Sedimenticola sp.]
MDRSVSQASKAIAAQPGQVQRAEASDSARRDALLARQREQLRAATTAREHENGGNVAASNPDQHKVQASKAVQTKSNVVASSVPHSSSNRADSDAHRQSPAVRQSGLSKISLEQSREANAVGDKREEIERSPLQQRKPKPASSDSIKSSTPVDSEKTTKTRLGENNHLPSNRRAYNPIWPLLLLAVSVNLFFLLQVKELWDTREMLGGQYESQQQALRDAQNVRQQLNAIAKEINQLAEGGNKNAALVVSQMKQSGFTFNRE